MEIILGVVMFTLIVLVLSGLILAARAKLVNSGDVVIDINDDPQNQIRTPAGISCSTRSPVTAFLSPRPAAAAAPAGSAA
jgi:Na+-transporting NADH:ubiquinone oxidoreductase subunit NqrF